MKIEIKSHFTGEVLFTHEAEENTIKMTVEAAVSARANLAGANLSCANLAGANLSCANLSCANLAAPASGAQLTADEAQQCAEAIRNGMTPAMKMFIPAGWNVILEKLDAITRAADQINADGPFNLIDAFNGRCPFPAWAPAGQVSQPVPVEPENPCSCVPDSDNGSIAHLCRWHRDEFGKAYRMQNIADTLTVENILKLPQDKLRLFIAHGIQESTARKKAESELAALRVESATVETLTKTIEAFQSELRQRTEELGNQKKRAESLDQELTHCWKQQAGAKLALETAESELAALRARLMEPDEEMITEAWKVSKTPFVAADIKRIFKAMTAVALKEVGK